MNQPPSRLRPRRPAAPYPPGDARPAAPRRPPERVYGLNAVLAVVARRPDDVMRVTYTREARPALDAVIQMAVARRIPCGEATDNDLARAAESVHHEGVCAIVRPRPPEVLEALAAVMKSRGAAVALGLDRVANPHNLGAIVRSAAYFGVDGLIVADTAFTPSAVRIAEGGAEYVPVVRVQALAAALGALRKRGIHVFGTDARAPVSALGYAWPLPCVLVLGNERDGLSPAVRAECEGLVAIPGGGAVDSLNVSVAAGVVLAELARARTAQGRR